MNNIIISQPSKSLVTLFDAIASTSMGLKLCMRKNDVNQNKSADHKAVTVLAYRTIKFIDTYLLVAQAGYLEPAGALMRSVYETYVWSRWVVLGHGQEYLDTGKI